MVTTQGFQWESTWRTTLGNKAQDSPWFLSLKERQPTCCTSHTWKIWMLVEESSGATCDTNDEFQSLEGRAGVRKRNSCGTNRNCDNELCPILTSELCSHYACKPCTCIWSVNEALISRPTRHVPRTSTTSIIRTVARTFHTSCCILQTVKNYSWNLHTEDRRCQDSL